jgi:hypothetical protein
MVTIRVRNRSLRNHRSGVRDRSLTIEEVSRSAGGMSNTRATLKSVAGGKARAENRRELMIRRG